MEDFRAFSHILPRLKRQVDMFLNSLSVFFVFCILQGFHEARALTHIGGVGNKQFYYTNQKLTWDSMTSFCLSNRLKMVAIETVQEFDFLSTKLPRLGWFWTAGRDIGTKAQFKWTTNGGPIGQFQPWNGNTFKRRSCVDFIPAMKPSLKGAWDDFPCEWELYTMCQSY